MQGDNGNIQKYVHIGVSIYKYIYISSYNQSTIQKCSTSIYIYKYIKKT